MGDSNIHPPPLDKLSKRGGSGTFALTNTLDPSLYPTTPPVSAYKGGVPKIAGSEGGFIGLVVGLGVLILICCGGVFYLLRTRPHGGRSGNKNHPHSGAAPKLPTGLFASRRNKNAGWMQQGNEFDYDSAEDEDLMSRKGSKRYGDGGTGYTGQPMRDAKLNALSTPALSPAADAYTDPFDPERLPESVRRQQAPLPSLVQNPQPRSHNSLDKTPKQSPTTPTFEGGTKFREQF